jgi:predicted DNA-binding transcriptional regulator YafY
MKLIKTLKIVINEAASIDDVRDSISNKKVIIIYYDGDDNGGKGYRTIEPVCLGVSKRGNFVLRAWESEGSSFSAKNKGNYLPGWRLFRLDKIFTYRPTMDNFNTMRPNYNPNGDKTMDRVFINAKFNSEENIS